MRIFLIVLFVLSQIPNNNYLMSSFDQEKQERINSYKKQIRNQHSGSNFRENQKQELKEVYMCECGKQYQSFPATYLHFRSKHDIKLSTKSSERRKVVEIEGDIKKITYVLEIKNQQKLYSPENSLKFDEQPPTDKDQHGYPELDLVQQCVQRYLKICQSQNSGLYQKLINFINMSYKQKLGENLPDVGQIPYFLNDFAMNYLPQYFDYVKVGSKFWEQCCSELKSFCDWLRIEKYTDLLVVYDKI